MREDHLKRQIDMLARALGKVLFGLVGVRTGQILPGEQRPESIKEEGGLDYDVFALSDEELIKVFQTDKRWNADTISQLADIYKEMGEADQQAPGKYFERALVIYQFLDNFTRTFSEERQKKAAVIREKLKNEKK